MKNIKEPPTYEGEVLSVLAFEFKCTDQSESDRKIKRRLQRKKLGPYDRDRVEIIRRFKNDVQEEIGKETGSKFWMCSHGQYADMQDWNIDGLENYFEKRHPLVSKETIGNFLPYAIFICYLK